MAAVLPAHFPLGGQQGGFFSTARLPPPMDEEMRLLEQVSQYCAPAALPAPATDFLSVSVCVRLSALTGSLCAAAVRGAAEGRERQAGEAAPGAAAAGGGGKGRSLRGAAPPAGRQAAAAALLSADAGARAMAGAVWWPSRAARGAVLLGVLGGCDHGKGSCGAAAEPQRQKAAAARCGGQLPSAGCGAVHTVDRTVEDRF